MPSKIFAKLFSSKYVSMTDEELMKLVQANDNTAFETIYSRYRLPVHSYLSGLVDSSLAEELMQETFIKVINKNSTFKFESKVKTWIWTIAKNTLHDYWRSIDHRFSNSLESLLSVENGEELYESQLDSQEEALLKKVTQKQLETCIRELPEDQREIMFLHVQSELSNQEISAMTGASIGAVKSVLFRCKEKLTACFKRGGHL
jgi:RNA polymerase sigma-70 factor (ECF subfamily)